MANRLVVIEVSELESLIESKLRAVLSEQTPPAEIPEKLTRAEALKYLNIGPSTLWHWQRDGKVTPHRIGRKVFFFKHELDSAYRKGPV